MKRYLTAALVALVGATGASAQPPPPPATPTFNPALGSQFLPIGPPPPLPPVNFVLPGPVPTPGPPLTPGNPGFYKSGGVIVGANGAYPYDTGVFLLGGMDGLARSTGTFTMVPAGPPGDPYLKFGGSGDTGGYVMGRCHSVNCLGHFGR